MRFGEPEIAEQILGHLRAVDSPVAKFTMPLALSLS